MLCLTTVMNALLFYQPNSEHERRVEDYLRDFTAQTSKQLPTVDVDSSEGMALSQLYDVVRYPTIVATDNQGRELQRWDGDMLPQINEVSFYLQD
jgi:hypothetical protein